MRHVNYSHRKLFCLKAPLIFLSLSRKLSWRFYSAISAPIFDDFESLPLRFWSDVFINEQRKTLVDEKQFSFTDLSWEINFALYEFSNCWRHLLPKKARHVPSIIHTNWVLLAMKLHCARAVHRWVTPGTLSNDSGEVIEIKVVSIQLLLKFNKLKPCRTGKSLKISLSVNVNGHFETTFSSLFVGGLCYWQWPLIEEKKQNNLRLLSRIIEKFAMLSHQ